MSTQIIGANGQGKTTLLQAMAGLRLYQGRHSTDLPAGGIHYIGHRNGHYLALTGRENLTLSTSLLQGPADAVSQAIDAWQLGSIPLDRPISQLSAGQQRRIALARLSLAHRSVWLLDEPLVHLDPEASELVLQHCAAHCHQGGTVVVTAHQDMTKQYDLPWLTDMVVL